MGKRVVGVHNGHNSSAAVVEDGLLAFALQEERLTRVKNQGGLPKLTLQRIASDFPADGLNGTGLPLAFGGRNLTACDWQRDAILESYGRTSSGPVGGLKRLARKNAFVSDSINLVKFRYLENELKSILPRENPDAQGFDHHLSHAAAAYFGWGKMDEKVLVLTCDGAGDCACASVSVGEGGVLKTIARTEESHSVGAFFGKITYLLGMVPMEHEYKVMGLAPYAENAREARGLADEFGEMFEFDPHNLMIWRRKNGSPAMQFASAYLADHIRRKRFDHVAAGAQLFIEQFLGRWVENCVRLTGIRKVALSGGVFMNVKANKKILELADVEELFVFPSCGDETNAIGAAWLRYHQMYKQVPRPLEHLYLGTACSEQEVERAIKNYEFTSAVFIEVAPEIERQAAELLAAKKIVARFKGRCEFGARALGNRSILANAADTNAVRTINSMIKCRDFWMPFAPSVLAERSEDYFRKPKPMPAPHMIMTFDTRDEKRAAIPAAIHPQDFTGRPQEVFEATNPSYYNLIKHFEELTGEGLILNTSFNLHGEPVVCTAEDALRVFDVSGLEYLALENILLKKV
jgi:carbamoyltransferase